MIKVTLILEPSIDELELKRMIEKGEIDDIPRLGSSIYLNNVEEPSIHVADCNQVIVEILNNLLK